MVAVAIAGAGVLGAAGSVIGGSEAASGASDAAKAQLQMYNQTRSDLLPYNTAGQQAISNLSNLMGQGGPTASANMLAGLQNYPGYQFALNQGQTALDRSAAARGQLLSGGQLKDLTGYGQGMGSQLFNQYFNQNLSLGQLGESAASQTGNAGTAAAANAGQADIAAGNALGSTIGGASNSLFGNGGVFQSALNAYQVSNPSLAGQSTGAEFGWT